MGIELDFIVVVLIFIFAFPHYRRSITTLHSWCCCSYFAVITFAPITNAYVGFVFFLFSFALSLRRETYKGKSHNGLQTHTKI